MEAWEGCGVGDGTGPCAIWTAGSMGWSQGEGAISPEPGLAIGLLRTSGQGQPTGRFPAGGEAMWDLARGSLLCKEAAAADGLRKGNSRSKSMEAFSISFPGAGS